MTKFQEALLIIYLSSVVIFFIGRIIFIKGNSRRVTVDDLIKTVGLSLIPIVNTVVIVMYSIFEGLLYTAELCVSAQSWSGRSYSWVLAKLKIDRHKQVW